MPYFHFPHFPFPNFNYYRRFNINPSFSKNDNLKSNNADDSPSKKSSSKEEKHYLELLGLNLYFDDILLIYLIFFLYQEGVKDEELFVSLILLLLS